MSTKAIYNFRKVNENTLTGGQPTEDQLRAAAAEGVKVVINLATHNPGHSLPDEGGLVSSLGMAYHHIPVDWGSPTLADFEAFERVMKENGGEKTLIHCAANFRVTAFYGLYAMRNLGWSEKEADQFRSPIWQGSNYPVWEDFIRGVKGSSL